MIRRALYLLGLLLLAIVAAVAIWLFIANRNPDLDQPSTPPADAAQQIARGEYLARIGNCMSCHTARGGHPYAGGRAVPTPFGDIYASNLTPDKQTGIGDWNSDDFWRAMHNGRSKDGSLLYPAFPYTSFTKVTRADSDAIFAWLQTLPSVNQENRPPELRSPYENRWLLYAWRALYFRPGQYANDDSRSVAWNRGAYLAQGLGHCAACHSTRNNFGGIDEKAELGGGMIPILNWYAPPLNGDRKDGLGAWEIEHIAAFMQTGITPQRAATGPMAEVVASSLQHLTNDDARAIAGYLQSLPQQSAPPLAGPDLREEGKKAMISAGAKLYKDNCAACHQESGRGVPSVYPALADNRAVTSPVIANVIRVVLHGGFAPSTAGNPRPYGMPPFAQSLRDDEVAAVVTYIRNAWGNEANAVSPVDVNRYRSRPLP